MRTPRDEWVLPIIAELTSADTAEKAREAAGESIWEAATKLKLVESGSLIGAISRKLSTPIALSLESQPDAIALIPARIARRYQILPLSVSAHTLDVATANPWDLDAER